MSSNTDTNKVIRRILEDTRYAYSLSCESGQPNADYADYASAQALAEFRQAMNNPNLTCEDLCRMLRGAASKERRRQCRTPWGLFMTNYLERNPAANSGQIRH